MNRKQKRFTQASVFLFLLTFVLINWNDVSWMFNYRAWGGLIDDFFTPYEDSTLLVSANTAPVATNKLSQQVAPVAYPYSSKSNSIEIPVISITAPLVIGQSTNVKSLEKDLEKGVVYYPGSVLPGEKGQITVLGHSAPPNWPRIKYDWVFSEINNLNFGDEIIVHFNNTKYTYQVRTKVIVKPGEDIGLNGLSSSDNILTIVSCWPPGKNYQRIAVQAQLVKN